MNRQEAIQEQIDHIMDTFDFKACILMLKALIEDGHGYPESWVEDGEIIEYEMRATARRCMKYAATDGQSGVSYFTSYLKEGEDHEGPWVKIDLYFGERNYGDGTSYEKTTTTTTVS